MHFSIVTTRNGFTGSRTFHEGEALFDLRRILGGILSDAHLLTVRALNRLADNLTHT